MEVLLKKKNKKLKIELPYSSAIPRHIAKEKHCLKGYKHPSVHCSTVDSNQDIESTKMTINR